MPAMPKEFSLLGFVAHLDTLEHDMNELPERVIRKACEMVCDEAKRVLGTYEYGWPQLSPATIADRVKKGFAANEPLLRTGALQDSIQWTAKGHEGWVGSDLQIAVWQELGTSRMPPRSFLVGAAKRMEPQIHAMAARAAIAVLAGGGLHSAELHELLEVLHAFKETWHAVKENLVEPLLEDEDGRGGNR